MTTANAVPQLTILVPTRNEAENVEPLLRRLMATVEPGTVVLFVDDSDDDTPHVIQAARERRFGSLAIRLLHRSGAQRTGGLGGAALAGLERTDTPWVCVMDGDLQHPPEVVSRLLEAGRTAQADLVVGSRYVPGRGKRRSRCCPHRGFMGIYGACEGDVSSPATGNTGPDERVLLVPP